MAAPNAPAQTLATHLINQTLTSIATLETLQIISAVDAHTIRSKLPSPTGPFPSLQANERGDLSSQFGGLSVAPHSPNLSIGNGGYQQNIGAGPGGNSMGGGGMQGQGYTVPPPPPAGPPPPTLPPRSREEQKARALWDYSGAEADDLAFRAGDTLIIDEEVNTQWYRGRVIPQGQSYPLDRSGLFPSNYIEKISGQGQRQDQNQSQNQNQNQNQGQQVYYPPPPTSSGMVPYQQSGPPAPYYPEKQQYPAPPTNQMVQQPQQQGMMMQPQGQMQVQQVHDEKKNKFGKIGSQLGNAAVNGAGFGFGASIASEMVHKIF